MSNASPDGKVWRRRRLPSDAPNPPYFAPYQQPNPFFGTGNGFAPPRRLHVAAVVTF
jgi:hypothetical protein